MPDLDVLRQRVEDTERRLASATRTRERECEALMAMWLQIKTRFEEQESEIAAYRRELADLQDANVELAALIDSMIGRIQGTVTDSVADAVPRITGMARELLESEPGRVSENGASRSWKSDDEPLIIGATIEAEAGGGRLTDEARADADLSETDAIRWTGPDAERHDDGEILELTEAVQSTDVSTPGIKTLISRIERAVHRASGTDRPVELDSERQIDSELKEIEALRKELSGLRERLASPEATP